MNEKTKICLILLRYLFICLAGLGNLYIFYFLFKFPTVLFSSWILKLIGEVSIAGNIILFNEKPLEIAGACVSGAAYYLLFALLFSVAMTTKKRIGAGIYCFGVFFLANILRIVIMTLLLDSPLFDMVHLIFWHVLSTIFVLFIWFSCIKIFKIKEIPVYSDYKSIKKI